MFLCNEIQQRLREPLPPIYYRCAELSHGIIDASIALLTRQCDNKLYQIYGPLVNQIVRSATSVPANITEGHGRAGDNMAMNFYRTARGSLQETIYFTTCLPPPFSTNLHAQAVSLQEELDAFVDGLAQRMVRGSIVV